MRNWNLPREPLDSGLLILDSLGGVVGSCPLRNTSIEATIDGIGARVTVIQTFINEMASPIEANYVFPLPHDAAVDQMRITIGDRVVEGEIMRREDAEQRYEEAVSEGKVAALLDQERPNVFTQRVANIMPGASVEVQIGLVSTLTFSEGWFEFAFPWSWDQETRRMRLTPNGLLRLTQVKGGLLELDWISSST